MMIVSVVLIGSFLLQFVAVYLVLRLIKITGKSLAWSFIAAAIGLMALRRGLSLGHLFTSDPAQQPALSLELIALAISALMVVGIERITPIFTHLRATSERLRESETRYRTIFEHSPIPIREEDFTAVKVFFDRLRESGVSDIEAHFERHPDLVVQCVDLVSVIDVNKAALSLHGTSNKEEMLSGLASTFTSESLETFRAVLVSLWHGEVELSRDAVVKTLAGEPRNVRLFFAVCPGYEQTLAKVLVSLIDITERQQVERALGQREQEYRTVVEHSPDLIVRYDTQLRRIYVNPAWERASGLTADEVVNVPVDEIPKVPKPVVSEYMETLKRVLQSGTRQAVEFSWANAHGETLHLQYLVLPEFDQDGKVVSLLSIGRDITELKQAEQARQVHTDFLANMDRINRAIQSANDLDAMLEKVLDEVLDIFACDRAFLLHPCDPSAPTWKIHLERTRPEYPGAGILGVDIPMDPGVAATLALLLKHPGVLTFGPGTSHPLPAEAAQRFGIKSFMSTALHPKLGMAWQFGIHQCSHERQWTAVEEDLFQEIAWRLSDGLSSLLVMRDLRESEEKYRRIFETASEGIWEQDENRRTAYVNALMAEKMGYSIEELQGRLVTDFMFEEDIPDHLSKTENRKKGLAEVYERRFIKKDGSTLWTLLSATPVFEDGQFKGSFAMFTDITERKQAELRLKEAVEFAEGIINAIPDTLYEVDAKGKFLNVWTRNPQLLPAPKGELLGKTIHEVLPPEASATMLAAIAEADAQGLSFGKLIRLDLPQGSYWFELSFSKKSMEAPSAESHFLVLSRDVTDRVRMEEALRSHKQHLEEEIRQRTGELRLARDAAEAASKAKSAFLANMSHELRTPLNAILGFTQVMRQDNELKPAQRETLDIINQSGEHLLKLINDVLEITRIEAGKLHLAIASYDLQGMVRDVTDMMRLRAQQKGLQLRLDQSSAFPRYIKGDEARLRQILVNLVGNAVKFTERGSVTIRLGVGGGDQSQLLLEVEDTGPGIGAEDQQRLFKPFVQLPAGASQGGTGLGLSIVRQFVQLMGGVVSVESTPGKGSLFRVVLPMEVDTGMKQLPSVDEKRGDVTGLAPGQPTYRVLIAEDQQDNQLLLATLMTDIGFEVKIARNGEECVQLFESWRPDLIWMDRRMPVMDGVEATRRIRQLPDGDKVKIVAVTASVFKEQQPALRAAGMDDYVRKPFRINEIYESLARQLGVKFTYRQEPAATAAPAPQTLQKLALVDEALRSELRAAVESLDRHRISAAIGRIGELDSELGEALSHLADEFDYPGILEAVAGNQPSP